MKNFRLYKFFWVSALLWLFPSWPGVVAQPVQTDHVVAELISETEWIVPGQPFDVALRFEIEENWHTYWLNPGDAGLPTNIQWELPPGFSAGEIQLPYPERVVTPPLVSYGYSHEVLHIVRITPPADLQPGTTVTLKAKADWLVCEVVCIPGEADVQLTLPVRTQSPPRLSKWADAFAETRKKFPIHETDWQITASVQDSLLVISVRPPQGETTAEQPIIFAPAEEMILENSVEPEFYRTDDEARLVFLISRYREEPLQKISGVLINEAGWQGPGSAKGLWIDLPVQGAAQSAYAGDGPGLWLALLFAFIGGMILNLMPCVLPVLSVKILGIVHQAGSSHSKPWKHGLIFTAGVLISFWVLAGALLALRAGGEHLGWGFQLQSPAFIVVLSAIMFLFGLSLFGVFEIGTSLAAASGQLDNKSGNSGSFWSGVLATIVATPCTAPFMGSALGFALTQPAWASMLIFTFLGLGMAFPYIVLTSSPKLLRYVPKPGRWMESFKQFLGFLMMATVIWLVWVLGIQAGINAVTSLLIALLIIGIAGWVYGRWGTPAMEGAARKWGIGIAAFLLFFGLSFALNTAGRADASGTMQSAAKENSGGIEWQAFSPELVRQLRSQNRAVFIDFTAAWCLSCQVNERVALANEEVVAKFRELDVAMVKADWTSRDETITKALAEFGRNSVPLYVLYYPDPDREPLILPEILTPGIVLDALKTLEQ